MARTKKPEADALHIALLTFFGSGGALVEALSEWPGDHPVVKLHPQHFARADGGQPAIDAASAALRADIDEANANRERSWYGAAEEQAPQGVQFRATSSFEHRGYRVRAGDVFGDDTEIVREMREQFEPCLIASAKSD